METIAVKLKRRSQYQHAFLTANIRPECVRQVGMHLVQNGELFKKEHITFNTSILELVDADDVIMQQNEMLHSNALSTNSTLLQTNQANSSGLPDDTPSTSHEADTLLMMMMTPGMRSAMIMLNEQVYSIHCLLLLTSLKLMNVNLFMVISTVVNLTTFIPSRQRNSITGKVNIAVHKHKTGDRTSTL